MMTETRRSEGVSLRERSREGKDEPVTLVPVDLDVPADETEGVGASRNGSGVEGDRGLLSR
jgi:hypothetical protein